MSKVKKQYKARVGAGFSDNEAQIYGERISLLADKFDGTVNSRQVLEDARNEKSPLHNAFEWNNSVAGEKHRLHQAALLVNHIQIIDVSITIKSSTKPVTMPICVNITGLEGGRVYVKTEKVMNDKYMRGRYLVQALKEAQDWEDRYNGYEELANIFEAIEKTKKKLL